MDVTDFSLDALVRHCDQLHKSGKLSESNSRAWKTACRSLISPLAPDLQADVRKVDVKSAANSYKGNKPEAPKKTISDYESRLKNAIASFVEQAEQPLDVALETELVTVPERAEVKSVEIVETSSPKKPTSSYTLNVPLRPDFLAQLIIPYDIKHVEVKRILKMLEAVALSNEELDS